jgi:hypothetical protein
MLDPNVQRKLGQVVCHFDGERYGKTDDNHGIMAVGMIVKGKHEHPSRIVLRLLGDKYAIHEQVWKDRYRLPDQTLQIKPDSPSNFIAGDYFDIADIGKAVSQFFKRQREHLDRSLVWYGPSGHPPSA